MSDIVKELREHADSFNKDGPCEQSPASPDLYREAADEIERLRGLVPTCVSCGSQDDLEYGPDPFASEIHHKDDDVWECKGCRRESAKDI